jgi:3-hydroxybutyryl-CoA dehydrogenase
MLRRLSVTTSLADALGAADLVIEAAPEKIDLKLQLFEQIDRLAPPSAIVASNTSALSITEMAGSLKDPGRVAGMHFFNPVHRMKLVEIVRALESRPRRSRRSKPSRGRWGRRRCSSASHPVSSPRASTPASATKRSTC